MTVRDGRIVEAAHACTLGMAWFGDGRISADAAIGTRPVPREEALNAAADVIRCASRPLLLLAPGLTCEAQREVVGLADAVGAALDSVTSSTALGAILAAQERGRASATLGDVRHRADVVVWWGVDPSATHPRYATRYAPTAVGMHVPGGRQSRTVIAVDVGDSRAPEDADRRFVVPPADEIATLTAVRAIVGAPPAPAAPDLSVAAPVDAAIWARARVLAQALTAGRYVLIVADADRGGREADTVAETARWSALIALAQTLNGATRAALSLLRGGGNRNGADAVLTSQTGYPLAIDFSRGVPRYRPYDGTAGALAARGEVDAVVVVGSAADVPSGLVARLSSLPGVAIGPRASLTRFAPRHIAIDTGLAGVHEAGTALRLDDVPLPVTAVLSGPPGAATVVRALREAVTATAAAVETRAR